MARADNTITVHCDSSELDAAIVKLDVLTKKFRRFRAFKGAYWFGAGFAIGAPAAKLLMVML